MAEDLDLARFVGLDPDHRLGLADVAQQGAEDELRHGGKLPVGRRTNRVRFAVESIRAGGLERLAAAFAISIAAILGAGSAQAAVQQCSGLSRTGAGGFPELVQDCGTVGAGLSARAAGEQALSRLAPTLGVEAGDLAVADVTRSPGGRAVRFQQSFGGVPVFDGQAVVSLGDRNRVDMVLSTALTSAPPDLEPALSEADAVELATARVEGASQMRALPEAELVVYPAGGGPLLAWHVTLLTAAPPADWNLILDADSGAELASWNAIAEVNGSGMVFSPNPVQRTGVTTLVDGADGNTAALDAARSSVTLANLSGAVNTLKGDFADLTGTGITGSSLPYTPGTANEPTRIYAYQRSDDRFEEANVYYSITEAQKLIQALGFTAVNNRSIPVDVHFYSDDNSFYSSTDKALHFGDGGVDDAEDGDIVLHEYGHSIHDNQVPGWGPGSDTEQRAIGEGFGDLFAAMFYFGSGNPTYEASVRRYCVGEWDATSYNPVSGNPGSGCLRWINGRAEGSGADIGAYSGTPTEEHDDGRYWSAAMTCVFDGIGGDLAARNTLLRLVLDSQTRLVPTAANTAFEDQVASMLVSDGNLYGFSHQALIRSCASARNIANLPDPTTPPPPPPPPSGDTTAPETTIGKAPAKKTSQKRATFEFAASEPGSTFQCSLDGAPFSACSSPLTVKVKRGKHEFRVQATDAAGNLDQTPARHSWKRKRKRHHHNHH